MKTWGTRIGARLIRCGHSPLLSGGRWQYLIRRHFKFSHGRRAERREERNVGGVAADGDEHASDAGLVVASVEGPPLFLGGVLVSLRMRRYLLRRRN